MEGPAYQSNEKQRDVEASHDKDDYSEWRVDMMEHISVGKMSVREAAHCPS